MRGALAVDAMTGERWDLACDLIESGGGSVAYGDRLLLLRLRSAADDIGPLMVEIVSSRPTPSAAEASDDIAMGRAAMDEVLGDPRIRAVADRYGIVCDYVCDYDTGRYHLASVAADGSLEWALGAEPS